MIELIRFRGRERRINIPQDIGTEYNWFGVLLLEDEMGTRLKNITHAHMKNPEDINMEVLRQWVDGKGKTPVTWETLIQVLRDTELTTLADDIEAVKL